MNAPNRLPAQVDALLASAARYFKGEGQNELVSIIANARVEIEEDATYDNWNGGTSGHGIRLHVPERLFHRAISTAEQDGDAICSLLNKLAQVANENICHVKVCLDLKTVAPNWREETGALLAPPTLASTTDTDQRRLWDTGTPRIFLSHRADFKVATKQLKAELARYGAASFVAHEDIEPARAWQTEIERALATMDVLVALLSEGFAGSHWTNQEVGVALGRGVPVVSVRLDEDPRGFIGNAQAVNGRGKSEQELAKAVINSLGTHAQLTSSLQLGLVHQWEQVVSYLEANRVMDLLDASKSMPADLLGRIEKAFRSNNQLYGCALISKKYPAFMARMKAAL